VNSLLAAALWAQVNPVTSMGSHFRKGSENLTTQDLLILLAVVLAIGGSLWFLSRAIYGRKRRTLNNPRALFRELCRAHQLDAATGRLLSELAQSKALAHPAVVFLDPKLFADPLGPHLQSRRDELAAVAQRLFGGSGKSKVIK
jgi:hypothetical protein